MVCVDWIFWKHLLEIGFYWKYWARQRSCAKQTKHDWEKYASQNNNFSLVFNAIFTESKDFSVEIRTVNVKRVAWRWFCVIFDGCYALCVKCSGIGMNEPPSCSPCVQTSRALHKLVVKYLWFHGRAAMMAFCITRSTCKVSTLFYCICDWVRVNKNNGNVLRNTKNRLAPVSDGPRHGKVVFKGDFMLALPCVFCCQQQKCRSSRLGRGPWMPANRCRFLWLRNCPICPIIRQSIGRFLKCRPEWRKRRNV